MLQNLNILNLAIVESLDLNLAQGLSVLTGETGAGKSILLTALGLALGERADAGFIRPDCQRAEVNLSFDLSDAPNAVVWLKTHELDDENQCIIRRTIHQEGRSKAYINGRPCTLSMLKQLSSQLVEIHGQHAHLTLLDHDRQRHFLDNYGQYPELLAEIHVIYTQWQQDNQELTTLLHEASEQHHREDLFRYQLNELEQLDLEHYNYQALSDEHLTLANVDYILECGQTQLAVLDEQENSVNQQINRVIQQLSDLSPLAKTLELPNGLLIEAQLHIQEASQELRHFLQGQATNPQRLQTLENEIGIIQMLSRKHQVAPEALPEIAKNMKKALEQLSHSEERIAELQAQLTITEQQYTQLAEKLTTQRIKKAQILSMQISEMIQELGMQQGEFAISVVKQTNQAPKAHGQDKIEFLVSANKGLPLRPLAKVASGGELSRISLAMHVTTSDAHHSPTMIFDEVDSGIGGSIAEIIGQKLRTLASKTQVLCVTHLPQVASQGHQHLFVYKSSDEQMTTSTVKQLTLEERIEETARMLGGVNMTESTRVHAKEMLLAIQK